MQEQVQEFEIPERIFEKSLQYLKEHFKADCTGHDFHHVLRVSENARKIASKEGAREDLTYLMALFHDLTDHKFFEGDASLEGLRVMKECDIPSELAKHLLDEISKMGFRGAKGEHPEFTPEAKCVMDSDRLDAIGAIGISRCFAFGGNRNRSIFDPDVKPVLHESMEDYRNSQPTSINHFFEKLIHLESQMLTRAGREMAQKRQKTLLLYLEDFFTEWFGGTQNTPAEFCVKSYLEGKEK